MLKSAVVIFAVIACVAAKPGFIGAPLAYTAPAAAVVAAPAPVVTATSSQYVARNHNGIATTSVVAPLAAPLLANTVAAYTAPVVARYAAAYSTPLAYSAPVVAHAVPLAYAAAPVAYANAHLDAAYASSRVDVKQNYNAAVVPTSYAVASAVPVATPVAGVAPVAPIKYTAASVLL